MKKGFSIIEFLIYITILTIAIAAMGLALSNIFQVGARTDVIQEVSHNGRFAIQRIGQTINEASGIDIKEEGKEMELSFKDQGPIIFYVSEENDRKKLRIQKEDQDIDLTTDKVNVDNLFFKEASEDSVKVEMNISFYNPQSLPEYKFNSFFTSSFTLRN
jgi:type II secretory pathway pseudopilin PulG